MSEDKKQLLGDILIERKVIGKREADALLQESESEKKLLGQILIEHDKITPAQLDNALEAQKGTREKIGEILIAKGVASTEDIQHAFALQLDMVRAASQRDAEKARPGVHMSIKTKLVLFITGIIVAIMAVSSYFQYKSLRDEFIVQSQRFGAAILSNLARNSAIPILENDEASLNILLEQASRMEGVSAVMIADKNNVIRAHSDISKIDSGYAMPSDAKAESSVEGISVFSFSAGRDEFLAFETPIQFNKAMLGKARVDVTLAPLRSKISRTLMLVSILTVSLLAAGIGLAVVLSIRISKPVLDLVEGTRMIASGNLDHSIPVRSNDEIGDLTIAFNEMTDGLRKKEIIQDAFGKYVTPELVDMILTDPNSKWFDGRKIPATVMFTDVRGFTSFAEKTSPEDVVGFLNSHFTEATDIIMRQGGHVDKFIGDAVMAVFGALMEYEDHAIRAVRAAVMLQELMKSHEKLSKHAIGIGIATGDVIAGNIGSSKRMEYTVIGDTVNLASRLTGVAQRGEVIISGNVYDLVKSEVIAEQRPAVTVKGKSEPITIYAVTGLVRKSETLHTA